MAKRFKVVIVTPDHTAFEGESISATIPGLDGYLGIWANHAPLVAAVAPGLVELKTDDLGSARFFSVGTGFVEVSDNVVTLLTDTCEAGEEIDAKRAEEALARARQRLVAMSADLDRERARLAASRAKARIAAAKHTR
jgi:F-type H+-transporting ATPase subunit epsilon